MCNAPQRQGPAVNQDGRLPRAPREDAGLRGRGAGQQGLLPPLPGHEHGQRAAGARVGVWGSSLRQQRARNALATRLRV